MRGTGAGRPRRRGAAPARALPPLLALATLAALACVPSLARAASSSSSSSSSSSFDADRFDADDAASSLAPEIPHAAKAILSARARDDPLGRLDAYASLSEKEKDAWRAAGRRARAARGGGRRAFEEKIERWDRAETRSVTVEVKLVGFDGDGNERVRLGERDFAPYLDALRAEVRAHALRVPFDDDDDDDGGGGGGGGGGRDRRDRRDRDHHDHNHSLPIATSFYFHVTKAPKTLASDVHAAIDRAAASAKGAKTTGWSRAHDAMVAIPHAVADALIRADHARASAAAFTLYVMNPRTLSSGKLYAYTYDEEGGADGGADDVGNVGACPGQLYVADRRYAWIDLTAGPTSYGPADGGEGAAWMTLPRVTEAHRARPAALVVPLLGALRRACDHLFAPALDRAPSAQWDETEIAILRVTDVPNGNADRAPRVDADAMTRLFNRRAGARDREGRGAEGGSTASTKTKTTVTDREVSVGDCASCAAAMYRALKASARHAGAPSGTTGGFGIGDDRGTVAAKYASGRHREFLDAAELRYWLRAFRGRIEAETRATLGAPGSGEILETDKSGRLRRGENARRRRRRVVPVFLFDLVRSEPLLFDGARRAVAFSDMVVAVRTLAPTLPASSSCEGKRVLFEPSDVRAPLTAAILRTAFGVAPTHLTWSESANDVVRDYLFGVGNDPFGDLSGGGARRTLPFHVADAMERNAVFGSIARSVRDATRVLRAVEKLRWRGDDREVRDDPERRLLPSARDRDEYDARWAVVGYKRTRALASAAMHAHADAMYHAESMARDVEAIVAIVKRASEKLEPTLECFEDAQGGASFLSLRRPGRAASAAVALAAAAWALNRARIRAAAWWEVKISKQF